MDGYSEGIHNHSAVLDGNGKYPRPGSGVIPLSIAVLLGGRKGIWLLFAPLLGGGGLHPANDEGHAAVLGWRKIPNGNEDALLAKFLAGVSEVA